MKGDRRRDASATDVLTVEPRIRTYGRLRFLWALLAAPLFALGVLLSVRALSRIEETLAAEGAKAVRALVYDLKRGEELRVALEPGTDVIRVVAHAVSRGPLALTPHPAKITVTARGDKETRTEQVTLEVPGTRSRVTPEESDLQLGDPVGFNIDVHSVGTGEMTLSLDALEAADGLLVRVYRREELDPSLAQRRLRTVEQAHREHLAAHAWELDWVDLGEDEQKTLLGTRWRKVAAYHGTTRDLRAHAIALSPPAPRPHHTSEDAFVAEAALAAGEHQSVFVRGSTRLRVLADAPQVAITATSRYEDGRIEMARGTGEIAFETHGPCGVEIEAPGATVTLRAKNQGLVDLPAHAGAWRVTPARPAIVTAGPTPLVLRVTARRPLPRGNGSPNASVSLDVALSGRGVGTAVTNVRAERPRSTYERYDGPNPPEAPSEKLVFHVVLPAGATATLKPREPALDLTLAELDPEAPLLPMSTRTGSAPPPATRHVGENEWGGFVPRRPTNAQDFLADGRRIVRVPHRLVPYVPVDTSAPIMRVPRGKAATRIVQGRTFELASPFEVKLVSGAALPVRLLANEAMEVAVRVDDATPHRRSFGVVERITLARRISLEPGESTTLLVFGDDLAPGKHVLSFVTPPGKELWVHAPWAPEKKPPKPATPRWVSGDFDE